MTDQLDLFNLDLTEPLNPLVGSGQPLQRHDPGSDTSAPPPPNVEVAPAAAHAGQAEGAACKAEEARAGELLPSPDLVAVGALAKPLPATLAGVLQHLVDLGAPAATAHKRSAIRTLGKVVGRPLSDISADPALLNKVMANASRAQAGMSAARWRGVKSLTRAALVQVGFEIMPGRDPEGPGAEWRALASQLPDKRSRHGLSRFFSWCTREGIEPPEVDAKCFEDFHQALKTRCLKSDGEALFRSTVRLWNSAVETVEGWPQVSVDLAPNQRLYALPWDGFMESFRDNAAEFLHHSGNQDPLADDYARPVRPSTVDIRRKQIHQVASALVSSGYPIEELTGLKVLVTPANAKLALRHLLDRKGGATTPYLGQQAQLLVTIARYWVKDIGHADQLQRYAASLVVKNKGMIPKNRGRLRQFDNRENELAILQLAHRVFDRSRRKPVDDRLAQEAMLALAVEILVIAPMRIDNLIGLEIERHLVTVRQGRNQQRHIVIPAHLTKTNVPFEVRLNPQTDRLLEEYLTRYRPRIWPGPSPYLFPGRNGGRRSNTAFSKAIGDFIERETGLKMNVHLFRHFAAKLQLTAHPGDVETVRRLLGHTSSNTTLRSYAELRDDLAFRRYDETISKARSGDNATPIARGRGLNMKGPK